MNPQSQLLTHNLSRLCVCLYPKNGPATLITSKSFSNVSALRVRAFCSMAFKLTYTDGEEAEYDDATAWEVDDGVLKMGRSEGDWTVLVSPSHWAVIEVGSAAARAESDTDDDDSDSEKDDKDKDDKDDKDDENKDDKDKDD